MEHKETLGSYEKDRLTLGIANAITSRVSRNEVNAWYHTPSSTVERITDPVLRLNTPETALART